MERLLHQYFRMLTRYNAWANAHLYEACAHLGDALSNGDARARRALLGTLNARLAADKRWRSRLQGYAPENAAADEDLYDELEPLHDAREAEDLLLAKYVQGLSEEDLLRPVAYTDDAGEPHANAQHELLTHLIVEQIESRTRALMLVERCGAAPPDVSMLAFLRDVYVGSEALSR